MAKASREDFEPEEKEGKLEGRTGEYKAMGAWPSMDKASGFGPEDHGFKSRRVRLIWRQ